MLKIRRPVGRLIFNMGIAIPSKTVFLIETAPWLYYTIIPNRSMWFIYLYSLSCPDSTRVLTRPRYWIAPYRKNRSSAPRVCLDKNVLACMYWNSHFKDNTVSRSYNGNPYSSKILYRKRALTGKNTTNRELNTYSVGRTLNHSTTLPVSHWEDIWYPTKLTSLRSVTVIRLRIAAGYAIWFTYIYSGKRLEIRQAIISGVNIELLQILLVNTEKHTRVYQHWAMRSSQCMAK